MSRTSFLPLAGATAILVSVLAYAGSVIPEVGDTKPNVTQSSAVEGLNDPKQAEATIVSLVNQGSRGTETLSRLALSSDDLSVRGWAIAGLSRARGKLADDTLMELDGDSEHLVRTWAFAARVGRVESLEALQPLTQQVHSYPGSQRAVQLKAESLLGGASTAALLQTISTQPQLAASIGPVLLKAPVGELHDLMRTHSDDNVRRQAASWLASQATQGGKKKEVARAVIDGITYRSSAKTVPWKGGALYIPSIQWDRKDGLEVRKQLNAWIGYCQERKMQPEINQINNNLASVGLPR